MVRSTIPFFTCCNVVSSFPFFALKHKDTLINPRLSKTTLYEKIRLNMAVYRAQTSFTEKRQCLMDRNVLLKKEEEEATTARL